MWVKFMAFLATIIFIATGSFLLICLEGGLITLPEIFSSIERVYGGLNSHRVIISVGAGLIILGIFNIYLAILSFRKKSFVALRGPQGEIQIAFRTIEELVEKVVRDLGCINKVSTRIIPRKRKISLEVRLFLGIVKNVIDVSRRVQELVKEEIENVLGLSNLGEIRVFVRRISIEKKRREKDILEESRTSRGIELYR